MSSLARNLGILGAAIFGIAGCTSLQMPASHAPIPTGIAKPARLEVGAARVDITPPPGASTFGHGPAAHVAVGYWTRLYCRAFWLETVGNGGNAFALVACDLPQMSTLLQRRVAERACPELPASRVMVMATHTHAAPGHFFDSGNLGSIGSSQFPGYDDKMVDFLTDRIASAVMQARERRQPARMRWVRDEVWGLTRNRSLDAYQMNVPPATFATAPLHPSMQAIDPNLRVVQFEEVEDAIPGTPRKASGPIGSIAFFAMHPTVIRNSNRLFGGDAFGVATRLVERELRRSWANEQEFPEIARCAKSGYAEIECALSRRRDPVHAIVNTNEGDLVPVWSVGDTAEAIDVGTQLAKRVWATHSSRDDSPSSSRWKDQVIIDLRYVEAKLPDARLRPLPEAPGYGSLCSDGLVGLGMPRGGPDHPSFLDGILIEHATSRAFATTKCQGPKRPLLGSFLQTFLGSAPTQVPLALARLDDTWISFVPAELTLTAGARLNDAVRASARSTSGKPDAVIAGLANGYIQYVATAEEYMRQRYEGASTLYGPGSAAYLSQVFAYLSRDMAGQNVSQQLFSMTNTPLGKAEAFDYHTGPDRERLWRPERDAPQEQVPERGGAVLCSVPGNALPTLCMSWVDLGPGRVLLTTAPWLSLVHRDSREPVRLCGLPTLRGDADGNCDTDGTVDDRGFAFATRVHERVGKGWRWSTVMRLSAQQWQELGQKPVRIRAKGKPAIESLPFAQHQLPRWCKIEEVVDHCGER